MHTKEGSLCAPNLSPLSRREQSSPPRSKASFWQTSISGRRPTGSHHPSPRGNKTQLLLSPSPCQLIPPYLFRVGQVFSFLVLSPPLILLTISSRCFHFPPVSLIQTMTTPDLASFANCPAALLLFSHPVSCGRPLPVQGRPSSLKRSCVSQGS